MKKIIYICIISIFCFIFSFSLTSCLLFEDDWITINQKEATDKVIQDICEGITNNDLDKIKKEFRYDDISTIENFDFSISKLIEYVEGEITGFETQASGSDEKALGDPYRERIFRSVRYEIYTTTQTYKVCFDYWLYYQVTGEPVNENKIGIKSFDIINKESDWDDANIYYSGCPLGYSGINFDYKTIFLDFHYNEAYYNQGEGFTPVIINSMSDLNDFYNKNKDVFSLNKREDGKGYLDLISKYNDSFFKNQSLYLVGIFNNEAGYKYVPQWVYIGDFVMIHTAKFHYTDWDDPLEGGYLEKGIIQFIELPKKVVNETEIKIFS